MPHYEGMGLFTALKAVETLAQMQQASALASPYSSDHLKTVVVAHLAGKEAPRVIDRASAMKVPAVVKARAVLTAMAQALPLRQFSGELQTPTAKWLTTTATAFSPTQRILWTLDDLIFYGASLWTLERDEAGNVIDALRVPKNMWSVDDENYLTINGKRVDSRSRELCLIEGPQEGLLTIAADTIAGALALDAAWIKRVESPVPLVELHATSREDNLLDEEAHELVASWEASRAKGGTAYTPAGIQLIAHGEKTSDLFIQGRNALRLDIANFLNVPASLLEGSMASASLTYSTSESKRNEFADYSLRYWLEPISTRLSMDDICPPGVRVDFDYQAIMTWPSDATYYAKED